MSEDAHESDGRVGLLGPALILITPSSIEESIERARTSTDAYGFRERFRSASIDELIVAFNREVGRGHRRGRRT